MPLQVFEASATNRSDKHNAVPSKWKFNGKLQKNTDIKGDKGDVIQSTKSAKNKEDYQEEDRRGGDEERTSPCLRLTRQPMMDGKQHSPMVETAGARSYIIS